MKKLMLIMNPFAGLKKANHFLTNIILLFNQHGYECVTFMTRFRGDATAIIAERFEEIRPELIVCIGGDGTFNEVVRGMLKVGTDIPLGYIPSGTTNDLATSFHLSRNIMKAAENVMTGIEKSIDIGSFNGSYFSYVSSFGAFTQISYQTSQDLKNIFGHMAYVLEGVKELSSIKPIEIKLTAGKRKVEGKYIFGSVSNSTHIAGVLKLSTDIVNLNDGKLEVMLIKYPSDALELARIISSLNTGVYDKALITFFSASEIELELDENIDWTLDGEYEKGAGTVKIKNHHSAVRLILPPDVIKKKEIQAK